MIDTSVPHRIRVEVFAQGGECLLYHPGRDEATALNRSATDVWELCDGTRTVAGIARELAGRYGVDADALSGDVSAALEDLHARGLIEVRTRGSEGPG